jgi:hypothetical protein
VRRREGGQNVRQPGRVGGLGRAAFQNPP